MSFNTVPIPINHLMKTPPSLLSCVRKQKEFLTVCSPEKEICSQERQAEAQRTFYLLGPELLMIAGSSSGQLVLGMFHQPQTPGQSGDDQRMSRACSGWFIAAECGHVSVMEEGLCLLAWLQRWEPVRQLCHIRDGIKSWWTPTGTGRFQLHPKHITLEEEKSGHWFLLCSSWQVCRTSQWVLWDKGSKHFHWWLLRAELEPCTATGESWHMAEGLWWRVCSSIWQPQGSRSTASHSRLNILCFWLGDLLPQPKFGSQTKTVEENTAFDQTILYFFFGSLLYFHFSNEIFESKEETRGVVIPTCLCSRVGCLYNMKAWSRPRFNPLFCLGSLEFPFPTIKKKNPTAEIFRDVFGYMGIFLCICHARFLWSQFLFVGGTQILMEQERRTGRGTTWYNISSQKYGDNLLHFLLFALQ